MARKFFYIQLIRIIVLLLLISWFNSCTANQNEDIVYKNKKIDRKINIKSIIFRVVHKKKTIGTAFIYKYKNKYSILTAAHVIEGLDFKKSVSYLENENVKVEILSYEKPDPMYDLAILEVEENVFTSQGSIPFNFSGHKEKLKLFYQDLSGKYYSDSFFLLAFKKYFGDDITKYDFYEDLKSQFKTTVVKLGAFTQSFKKDRMLQFYNIYSLNYSVFPTVFDKLILSKGYIIFADKDEILIHLNIINIGGSGAPVLLEKSKKIVGILTSRVIKKEGIIDKTRNKKIEPYYRYQGVTYAISINKINSILDTVY